AWSAASMLWADSSEHALAEVGRVLLYLGLFLAVAAGGGRGTGSRWSDGLALGTVGIAVVALASRFFPGQFGPNETYRFFGAARLSYPLEYWNGDAIFVALGVPLLLRAALSARSPAVRAAALAPVPAIASVVYLTGSRGGLLV